MQHEPDTLTMRPRLQLCVILRTVHLYLVLDLGLQSNYPLLAVIVFLFCRETRKRLMDDHPFIIALSLFLPSKSRLSPRSLSTSYYLGAKFALPFRPDIRSDFRASERAGDPAAPPSSTHSFNSPQCSWGVKATYGPDDTADTARWCRDSVVWLMGENASS